METLKYTSPTLYGWIIIGTCGFITAVTVYVLLLYAGYIRSNEEIFIPEDEVRIQDTTKKDKKDVATIVKEQLEINSLDSENNDLRAGILRLIYNQGTTFDASTGKGGVNGASIRLRPEKIYFVNIQLRDV